MSPTSRPSTASRELAEQVTGWITDRAVLNARRAGKDWARIGRVLHMSRQAARKRFGELDAHVRHERPIDGLPGPPRDLTDAAIGNRQMVQFLANQRRREELSSWEQSDTEIVPW